MERGCPCPSCLRRRKDLRGDGALTHTLSRRERGIWIRDWGLDMDMSEPKEYLLVGGAAELERLRLQARV